MEQKYWIFKSEPHVYPFAKLVSEQKTAWTGIRNYQARNYLRTAHPGDQILFYHSGDVKSVVGIAEVTSAPEIEIDPWVQVDVKPVKELETPVPLSKIKASNELKNIVFIKQSRLSVSPLSKQEFEKIISLSFSR